MKITLLGTGYVPVVSNGKRSVESSIFLLANELTNRGHDVEVIDVTRSKRWPYAVKVLLFAVRVFGILLKKHDADIIQAYSQFPALAAVAAKKLTKSKAPIFYIGCSPYLVMPPSLSYWLKHTVAEKWALRHADRVVIHTKSGIRDISSRYKIPLDNIVEVPAGVDMGLVQKRNQSGCIILYPAVITPRKNQMAVVASAPEVVAKYPDCQFVFVGKIEDIEYYQKLCDDASSLGVEKHIEIRGEVTREEVFRLYSVASLMVFPTTFEMQGIVLVEAMGAGVPVVASDIAVVRDVAGRTGVLLVNPNDRVALANAIIKVLDDKTLADKLSSHGRQIAQRFGWGRIAEDFEREYHNATGNQEPHERLLAFQ